MKECPVCLRCREDHRRFCAEDGARLKTVFPGPAVLDDKYRLLLRIGAGGMGRVYKARHLGIRRLVAVKMPLKPGGFAIGSTDAPPDDHTGDPVSEQFRREAETLGRLEHPNVVGVTDFGIESERQFPYLVMPFLEGETLAERLRRGPLTPHQALPLFEQIAAALDHAHTAGILHRDLKPANVFLHRAQAGIPPEVELLDFGLSRFFADPEATPSLDPAASLDTPTAPYPLAAGDRGDRPETPPVKAPLLGTPGYVAPEILAGDEPTVAADIFAFGALIRATLEGRSPPPDDADSRPAPFPILAAAQAPSPSARPPSAGRLVDELRQALSERSARRRRRREAPRRIALGLLLGLLTAFAAALAEAPLAPLEQRLVDWRLARASTRTASHPPILLLLDDATLAADPRPLQAKSDEMGTLLGRVFDAGAAGIAIDLLLPEPWGDSPAFNDLVLRHADRLVLAAFSPPDGTVVGPEVVTGLITAGLGPQRAKSLFGFVNIDQERDGVVRYARWRFRDVEGIERPAFATRLARLAADPPRPPDTAGRGERLWIDFRLDPHQFEQISWRDLPRILEQRPGFFRHRLVLVGATYVGASDSAYRIPPRPDLPEAISGPLLQAFITASMLDDTPLEAAARPAWLATAGSLVAACCVGFLGARRARPVHGAVGLIVLGSSWTVVSKALFLHHQLLLPVAPFLATLPIVLAAALGLRHRLAQTTNAATS
ncbi:MAG: CHASE2 domain-containing protein [Acidobacteriota bacterium]